MPEYKKKSPNLKPGSRMHNVLKFIYDFSREHKYAPSIRQIGKAVNIPSTSVTSYYLEQLQRTGMLKRERYVTRAMYLTEEGMKLIGVWPAKIGDACPTCGRVVVDNKHFEKSKKNILRSNHEAINPSSS